MSTITTYKPVKYNDKFYVVGTIAYLETAHRCQFLIDIADYKKIKPYNWEDSADGPVAILVQPSYKNRVLDFGERIYMRDIIANYEPTSICNETDVAYINKNKYDNRRCNVRIVSTNYVDKAYCSWLAVHNTIANVLPESDTRTDKNSFDDILAAAPT